MLTLRVRRDLIDDSRGRALSSLSPHVRRLELEVAAESTAQQLREGKQVLESEYGWDHKCYEAT